SAPTHRMDWFATDRLKPLQSNSYNCSVCGILGLPTGCLWQPMARPVASHKRAERSRLTGKIVIGYRELILAGANLSETERRCQADFLFENFRARRQRTEYL